jgi:hypothetical protein
MEFAVELDPSDTSTAEAIMEARTTTNDLGRARQVIERAASLIAQNFDAELTQARSMLAGLTSVSQDERYRMVVNDLLTRYMERAEQALDENDLSEANNWLNAMRDDPFRILGRRSEIYRLENMMRRRMNQRRALAGAGITGVLLLFAVMVGVTRFAWEPMFFPTLTPSNTPTQTATLTLTPTITFTPSDTPTPTETYTPSATLTPSDTPTFTNTPTWTWTPSPTWTPSFTPTASLTPTAANTPTETWTPTPTSTASDTPTITATPSISPTPPALCRLIVGGSNGIFMRDEATTNSPVAAVLPVGLTMDALERQTQTNRPDGPLWYRVRVVVEQGIVYGWVRSDLVQELTPCPPLP